MKTLYTIGYQGLTLALFIERLQRADIGMVCDVREYAQFSWKTDFKKGNLQTALADADIQYFHLPELGLPADARKNRMKIHDVFITHLLDITHKHSNQLKKIMLCISTNKRVALVGYEKQASACQRSIIARVVEYKMNDEVNIKHI